MSSSTSSGIAYLKFVFIISKSFFNLSLSFWFTRSSTEYYCNLIKHPTKKESLLNSSTKKSWGSCLISLNSTITKFRYRSRYSERAF